MHRHSMNPRSLPTSTSRPIRRRRGFRQFLSLLLACLAVAGLAGLYLPGSRPLVDGPLPEAGSGSGSELAGRQERIAAAHARLRELSARYTDGQRSDVDATRTEIGRLITDGESLAPSRALEAASPFMGFGNVAKCVALGAKDKVTGGNDFEAYAAEGLAPASLLISHTHRDILATLEALRQRSLARANAFGRDSLQLAADAGIEPVELGLDPQALRSLGAGADRLVKTSSSALASAGMEAIFIRATWSSLGRVLQPLIAKAAKTAGAAGGSAVADGPLPFGEAVGALIAIGGGLWTAWDIKKAVEAHDRLPGEIEHALRQQLSALDQSARSSLDSLLRALAELYQMDT